MIGHDLVRRDLYQHRPHACFFQGPESVGKWTLADTWFRDLLQPAEGDVLRVRYLNADRAREVVSFLHTAPHGHVRLAIVGTDGTAQGNLDMMLKPVEEIPSTHHIIFVGEEPIPPTLLSRVRRYPFHYLPVEDVMQILIDRGFSKGKAEALALVSNGQVATALNHHETQERKIVVLAAVRCILEHDPKTLSQLASRWSEEHTTLLAVLCREVITGRWSQWTETDGEGIPKVTALKILRSLRPDVRPRLVVQSLLMDALRGES